MDDKIKDMGINEYISHTHQVTGIRQLQVPPRQYIYAFRMSEKLGRQCTYKIILRRIRITTAAVEKQKVLHIFGMCQ
jgi:hypothetical protein